MDDPDLSPKDAAAGTLAEWLARPESDAFRVSPGGLTPGRGPGAVGTFDWCPAARRR